MCKNIAITKKKLTIAKNKFGIKILGKIMLDKKMQPQITK